MEILQSTYAPLPPGGGGGGGGGYLQFVLVDLDQASSVYHPLKSGITTEIIES